MNWVVANWKDNKNFSEAQDWIKLVGSKLTPNDRVKVVVCPNFSLLLNLRRLIDQNRYPLELGSQDVSRLPKGAYTGEVAAELLAGVVDLSIIGHSERRNNFSETDEVVGEKVKMALAAKITPLVCVQGEDTAIPKMVDLIAYEPVFAIGTGHPDTPENADLIAATIKKKSGPGMSVLYGGSVTSGNVSQFLTQPNLSGVLVGKASLAAEEFCLICQQAVQAV